MSKASNNYILRLIAKRILALLLFLVGAMGAFGRRELIFFLFCLGAAFLSCLVLYIASPEKLNVTEKFSKSTRWNTLLPCIITLLRDFIVYFVAGLGYLQLEADVWFYLGLALWSLSEALCLWALIVNPFFTQGNSEQTPELCRIGPYKYVRHPAYSGDLIWCFAICLVFPHIYVALVSLSVMALTFVLTYLEDRMLVKGMPDYAEYSEDVDFMLIPYLW